jgi:hypothetical protein
MPQTIEANSQGIWPQSKPSMKPKIPYNFQRWPKQRNRKPMDNTLTPAQKKRLGCLDRKVDK